MPRHQLGQNTVGAVGNRHRKIISHKKVSTSINHRRLSPWLKRHSKTQRTGTLNVVTSSGVGGGELFGVRGERFDPRLKMLY